MNRIASLIKRIAGMPEYDRYLAHQREFHPDEKPLTEGEFYNRFVESRYSGAGSRCC